LVHQLVALVAGNDRGEPSPDEAVSEGCDVAPTVSDRASGRGAMHIENGVAVNSIGIRFARIPAGEFWMGSPESDRDADDDEKPQHRVRLPRDFYLAIYPATHGQYGKVCPTDYRLESDRAGFPIVGVSWLDAVTFCNALSEREGIEPYYRVDRELVQVRAGDGYRLPTEAEWEYACRAGSTTKWSFGEDAAQIERYGWCDCGSYQPVGLKEPNAWGLYDMHGNVWEWCWDWYAPYVEQAASFSKQDPCGPTIGRHRVMRGGSFYFQPWNARSAYRIGEHPTSRSDNIGFRLARTMAS
jgi:formylglycine-generating enzyme required for sulfatase activity